MEGINSLYLFTKVRVFFCSFKQHSFYLLCLIFAYSQCSGLQKKVWATASDYFSCKHKSKKGHLKNCYFHGLTSKNSTSPSEQFWTRFLPTMPLPATFTEFYGSHKCPPFVVLLHLFCIFSCHGRSLKGGKKEQMKSPS